MRDCICGSLWAAIAAMCVMASWKLMARLWPDDDGSDVLANVLVAAWAWSVFSSMALSLCCAICGSALMCVSFVAGALMWATALRLRSAMPHTVMACPTQPQHKRVSVTSVMWCVVVTASVLHALQHVFFSFPNEFDALMYHVPLVDEWLQSGTLNARGCAEWYNPGNCELLGLWLVAPFSGDFWVGASGILPTALLLTSLFRLMKELGVASTIAHCGIAAVTCMTVTQKQLVNNGNDVAVASLVVGGLSYGCRFVRAGDIRYAIFSATCLALCAGVKYYALGYFACASFAAMACCAVRRGMKDTSRYMSWIVVGCALFAFPWYVRNLLLSGSPFFPLGFTAETNALAAINPGTWNTTFVGCGDTLRQWMHFRDTLVAEGGLFYCLAVDSLPLSCAWALVSALSLKSPTSESNSFVMVVSTAVGAVAVFAVTPFTIDADLHSIAEPATVMRYAYCPVVLCVLSLAVLSTRLWRAVRWRPSKATGRICVSCIVLVCGFDAILRFCGLVPFHVMQVCRVGSACALAAVIVSAHRYVNVAVIQAYARGCTTAIVVGACAFAGIVSEMNACRWHTNFVPYYCRRLHTRAFETIQRIEPARPISLMYYSAYPFYGSRRQFRVRRPCRITTTWDLLAHLRAEQSCLLCVHAGDGAPFYRYRGANTVVSILPDVLDELESAQALKLYVVCSDALVMRLNVAQGDAEQ